MAGPKVGMRFHVDGSLPLVGIQPCSSVGVRIGGEGVRADGTGVPRLAGFPAPHRMLVDGLGHGVEPEARVGVDLGCRVVSVAGGDMMGVALPEGVPDSVVSEHPASRAADATAAMTPKRAGTRRFVVRRVPLCDSTPTPVTTRHSPGATGPAGSIGAPSEVVKTIVLDQWPRPEPLFETVRATDGLRAGFAQALRERRRAVAISQEELAHRADLHRTYVSQLERGLKSPSLAAVEALAAALDMRPHQLVRAAEEASG
jgi:DNA-binding XRE family transcriptional regulator